jgi:membrane protease YdiL (CAAX protease family)
MRDCAVALGLGPSAPRAALASALLGALLVACLPLIARLAGAQLGWRPQAAWLALGIFAQGGVAEEVLFRGFLYRHLRQTRSFWRAASLSAVPFAAAHLPLFWTFDASLAGLSLAMAVLWSFPLGWLFDRARGSIWPCALLHAVIQGAIKVVDVSGDFQTVAIAWVAVGLLAPWLMFLLRSEDVKSDAPG